MPLIRTNNAPCVRLNFDWSYTPFLLYRDTLMVIGNVVGSNDVYTLWMWPYSADSLSAGTGGPNDEHPLSGDKKKDGKIEIADYEVIN